MVVMVVNGRVWPERRLRGGCGRCPCTRVTVAASERGGGGGEGGEGGWSFSCRSRSKLQQTSGKALPLGREREGERERQISLTKHVQRKLPPLFSHSFVFHGEVLTCSGFKSHATAKLCSCGNEEYVKMSEMPGCQLKQIILSPAQRSKHTWCAHTVITPRHTHTHTHTRVRAQRNAQSSHSQLFHVSWSTQENLIKSRITYI